MIAGDDFPILSDFEDEDEEELPDLENNAGMSVIGPIRIEHGDSFLFTYFGRDWLPPVINQGSLPICWAVSTALLVAAKNAFHHRQDAEEYEVPSFSAQSIINGLPTHAYADEIQFDRDENGLFYRSSTFMALSFIVERGIPREAAYPLVGVFPYVGYYVHDRDFERHVEIYRPFKIPLNIGAEAIRHVLETHGPILGTFYCNGKLHESHDIYGMASNTIIDKLDSHCVLVVGVGRTTSGEIYLHIQNTYGTEWGENGYGFVSLNLFEQLQGIKDASVPYLV